MMDHRRRSTGFMRAHALPWTALCLAAVLVACASVERGVRPKSCSGVPGDLRVPSGGDALAPATHGPGGTGKPVELTAVARPATSDVIPLLYVFDDHGAHVIAGHPLAQKLMAPAFLKVEREAYWSEVSGGGYYLVPWLDACSQASMLRDPISFRAPADGLLFVQYLSPICSECTSIATAQSGAAGTLGAHQRSTGNRQLAERLTPAGHEPSSRCGREVDSRRRCYSSLNDRPARLSPHRRARLS